MKFSIITINLNNLTGLKRTVSSVFSQTLLNYEFIIIDGGSTDGSVEFINDLKSKKITFFFSEKDNGVYHAMNKGISVSSGEYLYFLNSGDIFYSNHTLDLVGKQLTEEDFVYGDIIFDHKNNAELLVFQNQLSLSYFLQYTIHHQSTFIRSRVFQENGNFNQSNRISSDWCFFFENIIKNKSTYKHIDNVICIFDVTGLSSNKQNQNLILQERMNFVATTFPGSFDLYCTLNSIKFTQLLKHKYLLKYKFISIMNRIKNKLI